MQRPGSNSRSSDEHRIVFQADSRDDAASRDLLLYIPMLKKERPQPPVRARLIHCIPLILMLCFLVLWCFSNPVDLVTKNGATEGVQGKETMPDTLEHHLTNFSFLKPVLTSQAPAPQNLMLFGANGI